MPGVRHQLENRDLGLAAPERRPHDPVRLARKIGFDLRLGGRLLLRMGRHQDAAAIRAIGPAVIRALEAGAVDDLAQGQPRASMDAQVLPRVQLIGRPPQDDVLA